ncbi:hypothetical protein F5876DRAFT_1582, partial [Lentinula aff. lateritia]
TFDWRITIQGGLAKAFQIFTEGDKCKVSPKTECVETSIEEPIEAYTDGSCMQNGTDKASAGAGVHFPNGEYSDCTIQIPNHIKQSNQSAEIIA